MKNKYLLLFLFFVAVLSAKGQDSKISFSSSDTNAVNIFNWAKKQALDYAFTGDPVGDWYEAAIAGRESFCIRDMISQSIGAHIIGLDQHTKNMTRKLAEGMSKSKDWCTFWEINRHGLPTPVDYTNDQAFWFNLPANFDFINCCYNMYLWTGDRTYLTDSLYLNFYKQTVYDYVDHWDLGIKKIMHRNRIMNVSDNPTNKNNRFLKSRGIPGYDETNNGFKVGLELLVLQYSGYLAYSKIQGYKGDNEESVKFLRKANEVKALIDSVWWDKEKGSYYFYLDKDGVLVHDHNVIARPVLFWDAAEPSKLNVVVDSLVAEVKRNSRFGNIYQNQICRALYRYGKPEIAYDLLNKFSKGWGNTYPEMSFGALEAIVTGMMGIELEIHPTSESITYGGYVERFIITTPRLSSEKGWAELSHLKIGANDITVRHDGITETTLTNNSGPGLMWKVRIPGSFDVLYANSNRVKKYTVKTTKEALYPGGPMMSWARIEIVPGESVIVRTDK